MTCPRACGGVQKSPKKLSKPQVLRSLKNLQQKAKNKQKKIMSLHERGGGGGGGESRN